MRIGRYPHEVEKSKKIKVVSIFSWFGAAVMLALNFIALPAYAAPTLNQLIPNFVKAGSGAFVLTVLGNGFDGSSIVRRNGSARTTTFQNSSALSVNISALDVTTAGDFIMTVFGPSGLSNPKTFTVGPVAQWTGGTVPVNHNYHWKSVATDNFNRFVAVGDYFDTSFHDAVMYSDDRGETWTQGTPPNAAFHSWKDVTFGDGLYVAVGTGPSGDAFMVSDDGGVTWSLGTPPVANHSLTDIAFGGGVFVAIGTSAEFSESVMFSPDGLGWTPADTIPNTENGAIWSWITFGAGTFVIGGEINGEPVNAVSTDGGATWSPSLSPDLIGGAAAYNENEGTFVWIPSTFGTSFASNDGVSWTDTGTVPNEPWVDLAFGNSAPFFGNGAFVAVTNDATPTPEIAISRSSSQFWAGGSTVTTTPSHIGWDAIVYGGGRFVVVGDGAAAWTDEYAPEPTVTSISPESVFVGSGGFEMTVNGTNFTRSSVVRFGDSSRVTTFVDSTQLTAAILASDVVTANFSPNVSVDGSEAFGGAATFTVNALTSRTLAIDGASFASTYTLVDTPPTITATPTAGAGTVTFTRSTPAVCDIDSSTGAVTFVGVGTCIFVAAITSDGEFDEATSPPESFTITIAPRTLDLDPGSFEPSYTLVDAPPTIIAIPSDGAGTITFASSNLGVCDVDASSGLVAFTAVGTCSISATIASDGTFDAAATTIDALFDITLATRTLTIETGSFDPSYDISATPPTITATPSAGTGDLTFLSADDNICTVGSSTGIVDFVAVGTCNISAAITSDGTFDAAATTVDASFDITDAGLTARTLSIDSGSFGPTYDIGATPPTITATPSAGFGTITFSRSTPAVCDIGSVSGVVSFGGVGTCIVSASIDSDGTFASAISPAESFAVTSVGGGGGGVGTLSNRVALSRQKVGVTANATVFFTLQSPLDGLLTVTFPAEFTNLTDPTAGGSSPCLSGFGHTTRTVFATKTACSGPIFLGGFSVINPPVPGPYDITWVNDAPGGATVFIMVEDQVNVTATVAGALTFNVGAQAPSGTGSPGSSCDETFAGNGGTVALGVIALGVISSSDVLGVNHICSRVSTNAAGGTVVTVASLKGALGSASVPTDFIPSVDAVMSGTVANYGICVDDLNRGSTSPAFVLPIPDAPFGGTGTCTSGVAGGTVGGFGAGVGVGGLPIPEAPQPIWHVPSPVLNAFQNMIVKAAISTAISAHDDYSDVLTFTATGTF